MKYIKIVILVSICIFGIYVCYNIFFNKQEENYEYIDNIENRYICKNKNNILIGNNKNQLDNGYYDVKVQENIIYVNKLYINYNKDKLINKEYTLNILKYINGIFKKDLLNILYNDILKYYTKLRNNKEVRFDNIYLNEKYVNNLKIIYSYFNNMLKIKLEEI